MAGSRVSVGSYGPGLRKTWAASSIYRIEGKHALATGGLNAPSAAHVTTSYPALLPSIGLAGRNASILFPNSVVYTTSTVATNVGAADPVGIRAVGKKDKQ
jgi:hypothetical protein